MTISFIRPATGMTLTRPELSFALLWQQDGSFECYKVNRETKDKIMILKSSNDTFKAKIASELVFNMIVPDTNPIGRRRGEYTNGDSYTVLIVIYSFKECVKSFIKKEFNANSFEDLKRSIDYHTYIQMLSTMTNKALTPFKETK